MFLDKFFNRQSPTTRNGVSTFASVPQVCAKWDYSKVVLVKGKLARSLVAWAVFHGHDRDIAVAVVRRLYGTTTSRRAFELALVRETNR